MSIETSQISQEGFQTVEEYNKPRQMTIFDVEELALKSSNGVDEVKREIKTVNDMLRDALNTDSLYKESVEAAKESRRKVTEVKKQIYRQPSNAGLLDRVKTLRQEIKNKNESISFSALEYYRLSDGKTQIERDGVVYNINVIAKVTRAKSLQ